MRNEVLNEPSVTTGHNFSLGSEQFHNIPALYDNFKATVYTDIAGVGTYSFLEHGCGWFLIQFHPEKSGNIFVPFSNALHSDLSIRFAFECAMFFVGECRKNSHVLVDDSILLYNIPTTVLRSNEFVSRPDANGVPGYYHSVYLFKKKEVESLLVENE